ncbi:MAG: 4-hydroxy-tetrahydrodipicolinate reductase [Oscillospiraceae bacterium]|nr:4-hydroxy-tetrahydrodipicolinate reductase [Oscillospiraceae bacterium]
MLNILLSGCNGRMGQAVSRVVSVRDNAHIAAGVDVTAAQGSDYPVYANLSDFDGVIDVVIDFSHVDNVDKVLAYCLERKLPVVLAVTGYDEAALKKIHEAAQSIPVFQSANMSLGANLLMDLAEKAAAVLGGQFDVEIVERHHRNKLDSPSGTALSIYNSIAKALPYQPHPQYDRSQTRQTRPHNEIGLHAVRGGTIVGDHDVVFAGHDEVIEIRHSAASREIFAVGAVSAANFIAEKPPGLYGMGHLIND